MLDDVKSRNSEAFLCKPKTTLKPSIVGRLASWGEKIAICCNAARGYIVQLEIRDLLSYSQPQMTAGMKLSHRQLS